MAKAHLPTPWPGRDNRAKVVPLRDHRAAWRIAGAAGLILAAGWWAYHNSLRGPFVLDDVASIEGNPTLRSLASALRPPQGAGITVEGRPVLNLSFAINHALGGTAVIGYHAANLAIHLLAALTLFGIVRRTLAGRPGEEKSSRPLAIGLMAALLWVVHPLQTESVTYVVQRAESLAGLFYLLTLYGFIRWTAAGRPASSWAWVSFLSCLLGMGTKEVTVTAPILVALYDLVFVGGNAREIGRRRRAYYLALAATWLPLAALVAGAGSRGHTIGPSSGITGWAYALSQSRAVVHYLGLAIWPAPLIIDYGSDLVRDFRSALPALLFDGGLLVLTAAALRRRPALGFLGAAFFLLLAPSSSVVGGTRQMLAEHRMYLPLAPLAILTAIALWAALGRYGMIAALALAAGLGAATVRRNADYATALGLYADTAAQRPGNAYAQCNYGFALEQAGRPQAALERFQTAIKIKPDYALAHFNLGVVLCQVGHAAEGIEHYREALRLQPTYAEAHNNLGVALAQAGRVAEAETEFAAAVRLQPDFAEAEANLAAARQQLSGMSSGKK